MKRINDTTTRKKRICYTQRWPNPWPRVFGYHEIFHLLVIAGSMALAACVWIYALPFPRH